MLNSVKGFFEFFHLIGCQAVVLEAVRADWDRMCLSSFVLAKKDVGESHAGRRDVVEANVIIARFADSNCDAVELLVARCRGCGRKASILTLLGAFANTTRNSPAAQHTDEATLWQHTAANLALKCSKMC